jgi:hypothetical protein
VQKQNGGCCSVELSSLAVTAAHAYGVRMRGSGEGAAKKQQTWPQYHCCYQMQEIIDARKSGRLVDAASTRQMQPRSAASLPEEEEEEEEEGAGGGVGGSHGVFPTQKEKIESVQNTTESSVSTHGLPPPALRHHASAASPVRYGCSCSTMNNARVRL